MGNEQGRELSAEELRRREIKQMDWEMKKKLSTGQHYNLKVLIRGEANTGKTCLWNRLQDGPFIEEHIPTREIQVANINWCYRASNDKIKVEIWDVVDKGKLKNPPAKPDLKLSHETQSSGQEKGAGVGGMYGEGSYPLNVLDANTIDVMQGAHAVIMIFDPIKKWTWTYAQNEIQKIPSNIHVLLLTNFMDLSQHRVIPEAEVEEFARSVGDHVVCLQSSMVNKYGLKGISCFLNLPFLQLQQEVLEQQLAQNKMDISNAREEVHLLHREENYDYYLKWAQKNKGGPSFSTMALPQPENLPPQKKTGPNPTNSKQQPQRAGAQAVSQPPPLTSAGSQPNTISRETGGPTPSSLPQAQAQAQQSGKPATSSQSVSAVPQGQGQSGKPPISGVPSKGAPPKAQPQSLPQAQSQPKGQAPQPTSKKGQVTKPPSKAPNPEDAIKQLKEMAQTKKTSQIKDLDAFVPEADIDDFFGDDDDDDDEKVEDRKNTKKGTTSSKGPSKPLDSDEEDYNPLVAADQDVDDDQDFFVSKSKAPTKTFSSQRPTTFSSPAASASPKKQAVTSSKTNTSLSSSGSSRATVSPPQKVRPTTLTTTPTPTISTPIRDSKDPNTDPDTNRDTDVFQGFGRAVASTSPTYEPSEPTYQPKSPSYSPPDMSADWSNSLASQPATSFTSSNSTIAAPSSTSTFGMATEEDPFLDSAKPTSAKWSDDEEESVPKPDVPSDDEPSSNGNPMVLVDEDPFDFGSDFNYKPKPKPKSTNNNNKDKGNKPLTPPKTSRNDFFGGSPASSPSPAATPTPTPVEDDDPFASFISTRSSPLVEDEDQDETSNKNPLVSSMEEDFYSDVSDASLSSWTSSTVAPTPLDDEEDHSSFYSSEKKKSKGESEKNREKKSSSSRDKSRSKSKEKTART
eukprot:TRINITY_DN4691_c0_g1_i1.p1 TRINITY_DN4691_c0_g1~~TRINITY_DN4691_c0_g1_i1.p1  ORF type:complete len:925 (-),score=248.21 TRINITY_DN4691_c0_g1_i1:50-2773(-)